MDQDRGSLTSRALVLSLATAVATTALGGATAAPVVAADPITALYVDAEDHALGVDMDLLGQSWLMWGPDMDQVGWQMWGEPDLWYVLFRHQAGTPPAQGQWTVYLAAPEGETLTTGTYTGAVDVHARVGQQPGLSLEGYSGYGCGVGPGGEQVGEFTVHEMSVPAFGQLDALSASFRIDCTDGNGVWRSTYGELRYNATSGGFKGAGARPYTVDFGLADTGSPAGTRDITVTSLGTEPVSVTGTSIVGPDASSFSVSQDGCTGKTLPRGDTCVVKVAATPSTNRVLQARLRIADDTPRGERFVHLAVEGLGAIDATAVIGPERFYPVQDGYFDELVVEGTRNGPQTLDVSVKRVATDEVVYTGSLPTGSGPYRWTWDGHVGGEPIPAGLYEVRAMVGDAGPNKLRVTERVHVYHDWVSWQKKTAARKGRAIYLWGWSKDAAISAAGSRYSGGLKLTSGKGLAVVVYSFPVASSPSRIYGPMSFEVQGRSPDRHKAVIAVWNPSLGSARDLRNFDLAREVGPRYKWWKTSGDAAAHKRDGKARAAVMVWKGLGRRGSAAFDIRRVRLSYTIGTLHRVETASPGAAFLAQLLRSGRPAGVQGDRVSALAGAELPGPLTIAAAFDEPLKEPDHAARGQADPAVPEATPEQQRQEPEGKQKEHPDPERRGPR